MVWFVTPWVGVVVGLRGFLGSEWVSWVFYGMQGFSPTSPDFSGFFLFCVLGAQGFWAMGLALDWVSMVEFEL